MNEIAAPAQTYRFLADAYPDLGRAPVPVEPNVSPEYFERERERVFKRCWLQVCRIEDIPRPGDYLVFDMPVWRTSVLLVHGTDGRVRAFHNACKHRGNKVVARDGFGHGKHYACGFHGWTYDTRGALVDVPDAQQFFGVDPKCIGLKAIAADVWEGFVFLNYQAEPEWTLSDYLGPLATRFAGYPFAQMHQIGSMSAQVRANWKVVVDAFQEAFHVSFVHRNTVCDAFTSKTNPYSHIAWVHLDRMHAVLRCMACRSSNGRSIRPSRWPSCTARRSPRGRTPRRPTCRV